MGVELAQPVTTAKALEHNFTNEGGICGTYRFLKNIMGLWLVQRCRAALGNEDYSCLTAQAAAAQPLRSLIDVDNLRFLNPPSMPDAIRAFCRETRQPEPDSPGAFIRCALESLALQYRFTLASLRAAQPQPIDRIHILGGGSRNRLLNQMTADATGLPILAGPVEATAIGNIIAQAIALGHIDSLPAARAIIANSFELDTFQPENTSVWDTAYERYLELKVKK
jgi:rhamnulokinase